MKLTNTQVQKIYFCAQDAQFDCRQDKKAFQELGKIIADDPFKNPNFSPTVDDDIIGFWLHVEISELIDFYELEMESTDPNRSECTMNEMTSMIRLEAKTEKHWRCVRKRFKLLCLLALEVDVWKDQMQKLGDSLDENNPDAVEALSFYEDAIITQLEAETV